MVNITLSVPTQPILAGYTLSTQGYSGGGGPTHLHNAFDLVLGS